MSTPVISLAYNALYVVAFTKVGNTYAHRLHALNLTTGADKFGGPAQLEASIPGTGDGSVNERVPFTSHRQLQRAALLLVNDVVSIAFARYLARRHGSCSRLGGLHLLHDWQWCVQWEHAGWQGLWRLCS